MEITPEQIELAERLHNLKLKSWVTACFLIFMGLVLIVFIILCFYPGRTHEKIILGSLEGIFGLTAGPLAKHFFPALNNTVKKTKSSQSKKVP